MDSLTNGAMFQLKYYQQLHLAKKLIKKYLIFFFGFSIIKFRFTLIFLRKANERTHVIVFFIFQLFSEFVFSLKMLWISVFKTSFLRSTKPEEISRFSNFLFASPIFLCSYKFLPSSI